MSSSPSGVNEIAQLETRQLNESSSAIMVALNMRDCATASQFVKDVAHKVLLQRMISPPDTAFLCVTIVGTVTAAEFEKLWRKHTPSEPGLAVFLDQMQAADVIHGTPQGKVLDQVSLLGSHRPPNAANPSPAADSPTQSTPNRAGWLSRLKSIFNRD